jgi:hypothetical protein
VVVLAEEGKVGETQGQGLQELMAQLILEEEEVEAATRLLWLMVVQVL